MMTAARFGVYGEDDERQIDVPRRLHDDARDWLPFMDTYRTMCMAPEPAFKRLLEEVRDLRLAA